MGETIKVFVNFLAVLALCNLAQSAEFVPVYSWGTTTAAEKVPALQKISQDSFKDYVEEHLKNYRFIVVFAEQTLSPEDFAQKDSNGNNAFKRLAEIMETSKVTYMPSVQNPIRALKHLHKDVQEVSIESLKSSLDIPETDILIVDLNDAKEDEHRFELLSRHDSNILSIYNKIKEQYGEVLSFYTAYHTSWVPSEEYESRQRRSLLEATPDTPTSQADTLWYMDSNVTLYDENNVNGISKTVTLTATKVNETTIKLESSANVNLMLTFIKTELGYVELTEGTLEKEKIKSTSDIYAPEGFSYHCSNQVLRSEKKKLVIPKFQIQVFYNGSTFGDAYDCVGFTSAPIWSGLFVTFILLFIMTIGLTMMMDIKTMDRFDDAKGKTITINASE